MPGNQVNRPDRATIILDGQGMVVLWDPAAEKHLGYAAEEILGQHFSALVSNEMLSLPSMEQIKEHSGLYGQYSRYHLIGMKSGRFFLAEVAAQVERGPDQEYLTYIWITPAESGSRGLENGAAAGTSPADLRRDLLHEFNNLLMVFVGQTEILGHRIADDQPIRRHVELLIEASGRIVEIWNKLQAILEFWEDTSADQAGCGVNLPRGQKDTRSAVPARTAAVRRN